MTTPQSIPFDRETACQLLRQIDCLTPAAKKIDRAALQQALQIVAQQSDYQILGICADTLAQGIQALKSYTAALGYFPEINLPAFNGAVYIKYNPKSGLCYADDYSGAHRGVLVSCQSAYESGINEMFGHLPLDLFSEDPPGAIPEAASDNGSK